MWRTSLNFLVLSERDSVADGLSSKPSEKTSKLSPDKVARHGMVGILPGRDGSRSSSVQVRYVLRDSSSEVRPCQGAGKIGGEVHKGLVQ
jgi:hypothetical protein